MQYSRAGARADRRAKKRSTRALIDQLETRRLLTAAVPVFANGVLDVYSDTAGSVASVRTQLNTVEVIVDGTRRVINVAGALQTVRFNGSAANDTFTFDPYVGAPPAVSVIAGEGTDSLSFPALNGVTTLANLLDDSANFSSTKFGQVQVNFTGLESFAYKGEGNLRYSAQTASTQYNVVFDNGTVVAESGKDALPLNLEVPTFRSAKTTIDVAADARLNLTGNGNLYITLNGTSGDDAFAVTKGSVKAGNREVTYANTNGNKFFLNGGEGNDTFSLRGDAVYTIDGGANDDVVERYNESSSTVTVTGGDGADTYKRIGTDLADKLQFEKGVSGFENNELYGLGGDDMLYADNFDLVVGGEGKDWLYAGLQRPVTLLGGEGDDTFQTMQYDPARQYVDGGEGTDSVDGDKADEIVNVEFVKNSTISGQVFYDTDRDGLLDPDEHAPDMIGSVFLDQNLNGVMDDDEFRQEVSYDGRYLFENVLNGAGAVGFVLTNLTYELTTPSAVAFFTDPFGHAEVNFGVSVKKPKDEILDNENATKTGTWKTINATSGAGVYGKTYYSDDNTGKGSKTAKFTDSLIPGRYEVFVSYPAASSRATNVPVDVKHAGGTTTTYINERENGGTWRSIGSYDFPISSNGAAAPVVTFRTSGTNGYVAVDAIKFVCLTTFAPAPPAPPAPQHIVLPEGATDPTILGFMWDRPTAAVQGYRLEWSANSSFTNAQWAELPADTTSAGIPELQPGTKYYMRVRAYRGVSNGPWATLSDTTLPGYYGTGGPELDAGDPLSSVVQGAWTQATAPISYTTTSYLHDGNTGKGNKSITYILPVEGNKEYHVLARWPNLTGVASNVPIDIYHAGGKTTVTKNQNSTQGLWIDLGLYRFDGSGSVVIRTTGTTAKVVADLMTIAELGGPLRPDQVTAVPLSTSSVQLSWHHREPATTAMLRVQRATNSSFINSTTIEIDPTSTSYVDTGLTAGVRYYYRVLAQNDVSQGAWTDVVSAVPATPPPPEPPAGTEIVLDNKSAGVTKSSGWTASSYDKGYFGDDYLQDGNSGKGSRWVTFSPTLTTGSTYEVWTRWTSTSNRATNARYEIVTASGATPVVVTQNQRVNGGQWVSLGTFTFGAGASVTLRNTGTDGYVIADAVRFTQATAPATTIPLAPTNLSAATSGANALRLNWTDHATDESGYVAQVATTPDFTPSTSYTLAANGNVDAQVGSLQPGTHYYVRVRAINAAGDSDWSNVADATTSDLPPTPVEVVMDNTSTGVTKSSGWTSSAYDQGYFGANYLHDGNASKGSRWVKYTPTLPASGTYQIYAQWTATTNRASNTPFEIVHDGGTTTVRQNQKQNGGAWVLLGTFDLTQGLASVTIRNTGTDGYVVADAIRFVKV